MSPTLQNCDNMNFSFWKKEEEEEKPGLVNRCARRNHRCTVAN